MMKRWYIWIVFLAGLPSSLVAAHLIGGEISYECVGNNQYRIRMAVYRDCASSGAPFDNPAIITIYDGNQGFVDNRQVFISSQRQLPVTAPNSCTSLPPFVCTTKAIYIDTVSLPPNNSGYVISHQRCCRNMTIDNIPAPDTYGNTFTNRIPANDNACNNSPEFTNDPPVALCRGVPLQEDLSATDADGDSLVYSLCQAYTGGGNSPNPGPNSPVPDTAQPPPYTTIPFRNNFSATNPVTANPNFSLDPNTGILTGRPTAVGQYVFVICVTDYRNGQAQSTVRRDFQFNVTSACSGPSAVIEGQQIDSSSICSGRTVTFYQSSLNATSFYWDFGDPTTQGDTSLLANPTYTYPDTGSYEVMLVVNPLSSCPDTAVATYQVNDSVAVTFDLPDVSCFDVHSLDLTINGDYSPNAKINWNFGGATNRAFRSSQDSVMGLSYDSPGQYLITLEVTDFGCTDVHQDSIQLFTRPELRHQVPNKTACVPLSVSFRDSSRYYGNAYHFWDFGDGNTSNKASPTHTYQTPGVYSVYHRIMAYEGCRDTLEETFPAVIRAQPRPRGLLEVSPEQVDIYNPVFTVRSDTLSAAKSVLNILPDGSTNTLVGEQSYTADSTGPKVFTQVVTNRFNCTDTLRDTVYVVEPINFFLPNAFSPNDDGTNDRFRYVVSGTSSHRLYIYNRWGELVHTSTEDTPPWDGTDDRNGEKVPQGSYAYVLVAEVPRQGRVEVQKGHITVLR
ncbi:MAG: PKD domain-containing protein [Schleiferiaceae bacterium]|nr:PKD domain-containing protein [Schleiferiaceae bacterium]MDR9442396.1 PKD domain-containing protein [Schleiferiaceae bacterium]